MVNGHGRTHDSFYVEAAPEVTLAIRRTMIAGGKYDSIYFSVVDWDDGRALIVAENNNIIASRWLGIIDASTIPNKD
jgi:hypothetical protein